MKSQVELFGGHQQDNSRAATILGRFSQCGLVFSIGLAGCLYLSTMRGAAALPELPRVSPRMPGFFSFISTS